jgi:hypothetical protein
MGIKVKKHSKITFIILFCVFLTMGVSLEAFSLSRSFPEHTRFSSLDLQLRLIENIHGDPSIPLWQVRLLHNKVVGIVFDIYDAYLRFWSTSFLFIWIGLVGLVGVFLQWYYFFCSKRNKWLWLVCLAVVLTPFIEIFSLLSFSLPVRGVLLSLPFLVWSILGYWNFLSGNSRKRMYIVLVLTFVSLWATVVLRVYYIH